MILKQTLSLIFFFFVFFFTLVAFVIKCVLCLFFNLFIICSFTLGSIKLTLFFVVGFYVIIRVCTDLFFAVC